MIAGAPLIASQAAAFCTVVVLPQCVRRRNENAAPRAEQRGWAVACLALTVTLAAQISGEPARRSVEFRVTELGGGTALLALVVAAGFAMAHQRGGRNASSRPGVRAVMLAAGAVVALAAGMAMIVSRSHGTRPGQAFPWLCLLAAALATAASLVIRERLLAADSRAAFAGAYDGDGEPGRGAAPARRAWPESRDAFDDWDRPLSGERARPARDEAPGADWDPGDDWDPPMREDVPAAAARADPGPPMPEDAPARYDPRADWDYLVREDPRADAAQAAPSREPPAGDEDDEDVSDWFRPARKRAPAERGDEDIEAAASWEAPSDWFRPAVRPAGDSRDAPAGPGGQPEVADEPGLFRP